MLAQTFWKVVVADQTDFLDRSLDGLAARGIRFCVLAGHGVYAYVDPGGGLDLDIVIATDQRRAVEDWVRREFRVEALPHSLDVSSPGSDLRVQIQLDPRYEPFVSRASERDVLGRRAACGKPRRRPPRQSVGLQRFFPKGQQAAKGSCGHRSPARSLPPLAPPCARRHPRPIDLNSRRSRERKTCTGSHPSLSIRAAAFGAKASVKVSAGYFGKYFTMYSDKSSAMSLSDGLKTMYVFTLSCRPFHTIVPVVASIKRSPNPTLPKLSPSARPYSQ